MYNTLTMERGAYSSKDKQEKGVSSDTKSLVMLGMGMATLIAGLYVSNERNEDAKQIQFLQQAMIDCAEGSNSINVELSGISEDESLSLHPLGSNTNLVSNGDGGFTLFLKEKVSVGQSTGISTDTDKLTVSTDTPVSFEDNGIIYDIEGSSGPNGSSNIQIGAHCKLPQ